MKNLSIKTACFVIFLLFLGLLAGCDTFEDYGTTLTTTHERVKVEAKHIDFQTVKMSIQQYRAMNNGKNPESIEEIGKFMGVKLDPALYEYDPETGQIAQAPQFK